MQCRLFFHFCKNCFVCGFSINQLEIKFASHPMHFFFWDSQDIEIVCSSQRAHIGMGHAAPHVALESELVLITLRKEPLALQIMILFATTPAQMSPRPAVCGCLHFFCFLVSYVLLCFCFIRCIFFSSHEVSVEMRDGGPASYGGWLLHTLLDQTSPPKD